MKYTTKRTTSLLAALGMAIPCMLAQAQTSPAPSADTPAPSEATGITAIPEPESGGELSSGDANATQAEAGMDLPPAPPLVERLKPVTQGDVTYLCGGIGDDEATFMKQEAKDYDLMLTFAVRDGAYLANVDVDIRDAANNPLLQANCDSPIMLVDLPKAGTYRVQADAAGYTQIQRVNVAAGKKAGRQLASTVLVWPQQIAEAEAPEPSGTSGGSPSEGGSSSDDAR